MRLVLTLSGRRRAIRRAEVRSAVHRGHEIAISAVLANPLTYLAPVGSVIGRVADKQRCNAKIACAAPARMMEGYPPRNRYVTGYRLPAAEGRAGWGQTKAEARTARQR